MKNSFLFCLLIVGISSLAFSGKDKPAQEAVLLKAEYGAKQQWRYSVNYTSQGNFRQKSSNTAKTTTIRCIIRATKMGPRKLFLKADSVSIKSDLYKEDLQKEIKDDLLTAGYSLSLANGFPCIDTSLQVPASKYLEWDLYRQLAKLLPMLPANPVKPGFSWERTDAYPLLTSRGKLSCEVYRKYTFEALSGGFATISWQFRYAGANNPDSSVFKNVPVFGTGNGAAVLDTRNGSLLKAEMNFTTPVAAVGNVNVVWHENAVIRLVEVK
jgi:hypothetical protein